MLCNIISNGHKYPTLDTSPNYPHSCNKRLQAQPQEDIINLTEIRKPLQESQDFWLAATIVSLPNMHQSESFACLFLRSLLVIKCWETMHAHAIQACVLCSVIADDLHHPNTAPVSVAIGIFEPGSAGIPTVPTPPPSPPK